MKPELQGYWQFFGRIDVGEGFFFHAPVPSDATPDNFDFLGLLHDAAGFDISRICLQGLARAERRIAKITARKELSGQRERAPFLVMAISWSSKKPKGEKACEQGHAYDNDGFLHQHEFTKQLKSGHGFSSSIITGPMAKMRAHLPPLR